MQVLQYKLNHYGVADNKVHHNYKRLIVNITHFVQLRHCSSHNNMSKQITNVASYLLTANLCKLNYFKSNFNFRNKFRYRSLFFIYQFEAFKVTGKNPMH